jgi:hypothetical protein
MTASPKSVERGKTIRFSGYLPPGKVTTILIGPPYSEADPVGKTRTSSNGSFTFRFRIPAKASLGRFVALACQRSCRVKTQVNFRIVASH